MTGRAGACLRPTSGPDVLVCCPTCQASGWVLGVGPVPVGLMVTTEDGTPAAAVTVRCSAGHQWQLALAVVPVAGRQDVCQVALQCTEVQP